MALYDFPADRQSQSQSHIARREKRRWNFFSRIGLEAGAVVLDFDLHILVAAVGVGLDTVKQIESQLQQRNYEGFLR